MYLCVYHLAARHMMVPDLNSTGLISHNRISVTSPSTRSSSFFILLEINDCFDVTLVWGANRIGNQMILFTVIIEIDKFDCKDRRCVHV
jgi:hypothetical protein